MERDINLRYPDRILVTPGGSHFPKQLPWPAVPSEPRDHTGGSGLTNTLQCVSGHRGLTLAITNSVGQIRCSLWYWYDGGKYYGRVLCICWHHRIAVPGVDLRGP